MQTSPATEPATPLPRRLTYVVHAYGSFSRDDSTVVFQSNASGDWDLYTIALSGEGLKRIVSSPAADITPVYSPDGTRIVFVSERDGDREVYVCDPDGSNQRRLTNDKGHDIHPVWNSDGRRIMFSSNRGNADPADYDIYVMQSDGTEVRRITSGPDIDTYASWSPAGSKIVTRRVIDGGRNNEVFVMDADGANAVNLTNDAERYDGWPVWSPRGQWIAFSSGRPNAGDHCVYLMRADGSRRTRVSGPRPGARFCYDTQPAFSHDGKSLVFTRYGQSSMRETSELVVITLPRELRDTE